MEKVFRGDIFVVNLNGGNGLIKGLHPVVVINSVRSIMKADILTVLPITSNTSRFLKSHVLIDGYGLTKRSKVLVEQSVTINKDELKQYIGHVDNTKMVEINKAVTKHLDLDRKNLNVEDMVVMLDNKKSSIRDLEILKSKIYTSFLEVEYKNTKELCEELNQKAKVKGDRYYIWYSLYMQSQLNIKSGDINTKHIEESLKYADNNNEIRLSLWSYARLLEGDDKQKSVNIYYKLSKAYREDLSDIERVSVLFNVAKINNNIRAGRRLVAIAKRLDLNKWSYANKKEDYINQLELELNAFCV